MKNRNILTIILMIIMIFTLNSSSQAQENDTILRSENLLFLEVNLSGMKLSDEFLPSFITEDLVLVPIGQLTNYLELPFKVNLEQRTVEGFIYNENESYILDVQKGIARANDLEISINKDQIEVDSDDIYLDIQLISEWLPMQVNINLYSAILNVTSERPLPLESKLERRYRWEKLANAKVSQKAEYPLKENPYKFFSEPFIDHRFNFTFNEESEPTARHSTRLSGDFLYMSGRLFVSGPFDDPLSEVTGRLGRRSPEANLLGPLNAHEVWLGEVTQPIVPDISSWELVKGLYISSYPYLRPNRFYSHTFEGKLPENWEVELYDNGTLLDFQRSNEEGRYIFEDVPLDYGRNKFTLVFYDEYGQKYEDTKLFRIDSSLIPPEKNYYRIDIGQTDEDKLRSILRYSRGINENLSLITNYVSLPSNGKTNDYTNIGVRGNSNGNYWEGTYLQEIDGGRGGKIGFYTSMCKTNFAINHAVFADYSSEEVSEDLKSRSNIDLRRTFNLGEVANLGTRLELTRNVYDNNDITTELYNHLSTYYKGYSFRNTINVEFNNDGNEGSGDFWIYKYIGNYWLRGELGYEIPSLKTENIAAEINGRIDDIHSYSFRINRDLEKEQTTYIAGVNRNADYTQIGLKGSYTGQKDWEINLGISTSYGRSDRTNQFKPGTSTRYGAVSVRTYLDLGDKQEPLEGVGYLINNRSYDERTNKEGIAFIPNLRVDRRVDIAINRETLSNPFMVVNPEGVSFIPRPGQTFEVSLPVVMTSEIGGHVYLQTNSGIRVLKGVEVQLIDENNNIVKDTSTAFDGYFYLSEIIPGDYMLKVSEESIKQLGIKQPEVKNITLPPTGGYYDGFDFNIKTK